MNLEISWKCEDSNSMNEQIARRIVRELEMPELVEVLSERLSGSDLSSLLLAVLKRRVSKIDRSRIMIASPATEACNLDGRLLNKLENTAYEIAGNRPPSPSIHRLISQTSK